MNNWLQAIILGALQGVAEFLPISSSGHLVIAEHFLGVESPGTFLEVMLHAGTLVSILVYFGRDIMELVTALFRGRREAWCEAGRLLLSAIPAVIVYLMLSEWIESAFDGPRFTAAMLCVTGVVLISLKFVRGRPRALNAPRALAMGVAQAMALLPGVSRSGSTITIARHLGVEPKRAAEFSLLMSVPLLAGATGLSLFKLLRDEGGVMFESMPPAPILVGAGVAAVVGYFSIALLVRTLAAGHFWLFGFYCMFVGGVLCTVL